MSNTASNFVEIVSSFEQYLTRTQKCGEVFWISGKIRTEEAGSSEQTFTGLTGPKPEKSHQTDRATVTGRGPEQGRRCKPEGLVFDPEKRTDVSGKQVFDLKWELLRQ